MKPSVSSVLNDDEMNEYPATTSMVRLDIDGDMMPRSVQFCVCVNKYEMRETELCDRCANRYHVECAGDEKIKCVYKQLNKEIRTNGSIGFVCFVCRQVVSLVKEFEDELKRSRRWDFDCEEALLVLLNLKHCIFNYLKFLNGIR